MRHEKIGAASDLIRSGSESIVPDLSVPDLLLIFWLRSKTGFGNVTPHVFRSFYPESLFILFLHPGTKHSTIFNHSLAISLLG